MKFHVNQKMLANALGMVSKAVPSRPTHPILGTVLLTAKDDLLTITGFDLSFGITARINCSTDTNGSICLPASLLLDTVNRIQLCDLSVTLDDSTVIIKHKTGKVKINALSASEYPEIPMVQDEDDKLKLPAESFLQGLKAVLFSASTDEMKQILQGVNITVSDLFITLASTDGHRLSVHKFAHDKELKTMEVTIPAKVLTEISRIVKAYDELSFTIKDYTAYFQTADITIVTKILEGTYPSYSRLIPKEFTTFVIAPKKDFISALERVSVMADSRNNIAKVVFDASNQRLEISSEEPQLGSAVDAIESVQISGDSVTTAFNLKYLLDGLKSLDGEEVLIKLNQPLSPVILTNVDDLDKNIRLTMPIQLRN